MIHYSLIRTDNDGVILDVSIFSSKEYALAQYVQEREKREHPNHTVRLEIAFSNTWSHVKNSAHFKKYMEGKKK